MCIWKHVYIILCKCAVAAHLYKIIRTLEKLKSICSLCSDWRQSLQSLNWFTEASSVFLYEAVLWLTGRYRKRRSAAQGMWLFLVLIFGNNSCKKNRNLTKKVWPEEEGSGYLPDCHFVSIVSVLQAFTHLWLYWRLLHYILGFRAKTFEIRRQPGCKEAAMNSISSNTWSRARFKYSGDTHCTIYFFFIIYNRSIPFIKSAILPLFQSPWTAKREKKERQECMRLIIKLQAGVRDRGGHVELSYDCVWSLSLSGGENEEHPWSQSQGSVEPHQ